MRVAILGFGREGSSSAEYWENDDNEITILDKSSSVSVQESRLSQLGENYLEGLDGFDLIVRSPGVHPQEILKANNSDILAKVTSNTNEFFNVCPTKNIIGVTGTKGKGTTSSLIARLLETNGHKVHLGGNIGIPPLELLKDGIGMEDWVVLELSNFQLIDLKSSPHIAVCLLIEPEHQDWHSSLEEYIEAKQNICKWQSEGDTAIYYAYNELSKQVASVGNAQKITYYAEPGAFINNDDVVIGGNVICGTSEVGLIGKHNLQNICAALTASWQVDQNPEAAKDAITSFKGLPFRIELRGVFDGISYYNDSFSSQPSATIAAIEAIKLPKVMILGGHDRNLDLSKLAGTIKTNSDNIKKVVLIGASAKRIAENLAGQGYDNFIIESSVNMADIVNTAKAYAASGDAIVLSPGFPSFDMFKNFEERGNQFNEAI